MFDFKFTCDNGAVSFIRASKRSVAIALFCEAEGYSLDWVEKHCRVCKVTPKKEKSIEEILEGIRDDDG